MKVVKTNIPGTSLACRFLPADYTDTFRCDIPEGAALSPDDIQIAVWTDRPGWIDALMKLRNLLVKPFGLKGDGERSAEKLAGCIRSGGAYGFFSVAAKNGNETVVVMQDKHLNAWMSVMVDEQRVYCITVVKFNNRLGRAYFFFIKPFHKIIVSSMLGSTVKKLLQKAK